MRSPALSLRACALAGWGLVVLACASPPPPPPPPQPASPQESQAPAGTRPGEGAETSEPAGAEPSSPAEEQAGPAGSEPSQDPSAESASGSTDPDTGSEPGTALPEGTAAGADSRPGAPTGSTGDVWDAPSGNGARVGEIDAQIQEVMGTLDGILGDARVDGGRGADGSEGKFPTPAGMPGSGNASAGEGGSDAGDGAAGAAGEHASGSGYPDTQGAGGESGTTVQTPTGSGPGSAEDSDIFRRQICEAARAESDPELREALEAECRKYGGSLK